MSYTTERCASQAAHTARWGSRSWTHHAATMDFAAVTGPVLAIAGGSDRLVNPRISRTTASKYRHGTYIEMPDTDHLIFTGDALPVTMSHIDDWISRNNVLSAA